MDLTTGRDFDKDDPAVQDALARIRAEREEILAKAPPTPDAYAGINKRRAVLDPKTGLYRAPRGNEPPQFLVGDDDSLNPIPQSTEQIQAAEAQKAEQEAQKAAQEKYEKDALAYRERIEDEMDKLRQESETAPTADSEEALFNKAIDSLSRRGWHPPQPPGAAAVPDAREATISADGKVTISPAGQSTGGRQDPTIAAWKAEAEQLGKLQPGPYRTSLRRCLQPGAAGQDEWGEWGQVIPLDI